MWWMADSQFSPMKQAHYIPLSLIDYRLIPTLIYVGAEVFLIVEYHSTARWRTLASGYEKGY